MDATEQALAVAVRALRDIRTGVDGCDTKAMTGTMALIGICAEKALEWPTIASLPTDLPPASSTQPLIDAGKTLAKLADPDDDLQDASNQMDEIAHSLMLVSSGLNNTHVLLAGEHDKHKWREIDRKARDTALRTVGKMLVALSAWYTAVESELAEQDRRNNR